MRIRRLLFVLVALLPLVATAGTLTIGSSGTSNSSDVNGGTVRTDIDLTHPASATGTVTVVNYYWTQTCANALKIKFFRRTGEQLTLVAERGPYASTFPNTITLSPAVQVRQGDLIGVTRTGACGNIGANASFPSEGYLQYGNDVSGTVNIADATRSYAMLVLNGTGVSTESVLGVIPVVGSTPGGFGSRFRTAMQFMNPSSSASTSCRLVYHRAGQPGAVTDPTKAISLGPGQVLSYDDIVEEMGQTGLGSIDVILEEGVMAPMVITRVFNDAGSSGTSGFTEEMIDPTPSSFVDQEAMSRGVTGFLVTPISPSKTRFNIGVRTFYSGAQLTVSIRNSAGAIVRTVTKTYTANYFEQVDVATFVGGAIAGNESIQISVSSGNAVVYGATTDNTTNDPALQCAYGIFAIA